METSGNTNPTSQLLTVIPDDLKKLARLVVRGFYSREDILIIDMLVNEIDYHLSKIDFNCICKIKLFIGSSPLYARR